VAGAGGALGGAVAALGDGGTGAVTGGGDTSGTTAGAAGAFRQIAIATDSSAAASAVRRALASESARATALSPRAITSAAAPCPAACRRALRASECSRASSVASVPVAPRGAGLVAGGAGSGAGLADPISPPELSGGALAAAVALVSAGLGGTIAGGAVGAAAAGPGSALPPAPGAGRAVGRELQIHIPNATAAAPAARIVPQRRPRTPAGATRRVGAVVAIIGTVPPLGVVIVSSAVISSPAVCGRSAACFCRHRMISPASTGGRPGR
jgi:hypothetical protein